MKPFWYQHIQFLMREHKDKLCINQEALNIRVSFNTIIPLLNFNESRQILTYSLQLFDMAEFRRDEIIDYDDMY
jgi:hypothetical protein